MCAEFCRACFFLLVVTCCLHRAKMDVDSNEIRRIGFFKSGTAAVFTKTRLVLFWPPEMGQKHWEKSIIRLPSTCPAEFCTIRQETQLALLFQHAVSDIPHHPTPTELCIFQMEHDRSVGKLNWSATTATGAHPK